MRPLPKELEDALSTGTYQKNATELGNYVIDKLTNAAYPCVKEIRGRGLWIGIEIKPDHGLARPYCERLMALGMLWRFFRKEALVPQKA